MRPDYRAPSLQRLAELDAVNIGRAILPLVAQDLLTHGNSRDPRWLARGIAEEYYQNDPHAAMLIMEGVQALERSGMLVPDVYSDDRYGLSRAGTAASAGRSTARSIAEEAASALLHPTVRAAALGDLEQGPERYDAAVLMAFRAVEIAVTEAIKPSVVADGKSVFDVAFGVRGAGLRGILTPEPIPASEATALLNIFKSASTAFRNPVAHRDVGHEDPVQTMRLLITASMLAQIVDELTSAVQRASVTDSTPDP